MFSISLPKWLAATVAAVALVALAFAAFGAENTPHNLRTFATEAGLPTSFELQYEVSDDIDAWFTTGGLACFMFFFCEVVPPHIYVAAPATWPREWVLAMLYHEIGHYHQYRTNAPRDEWDADLYALRHLCATGMNGPEIMADTLAAMIGRAKENSPRHGNHRQRIENMRGRGCNGRGLDTTQSP